MGLSSCIKKAEQFIKKQRNEAMRKSGKPAADKLLADQTAALESLQAKLGDISSLNADDAAAADAIRSAIEDLFIDRESLEIQIAGRGIEVKSAPFKLEDVNQKRSAGSSSIKSKNAPIMRRDDIVGAIMRVTGGDGIAPVMAGTLVGDSANNATKLRGLFRNGGWEDMGGLAELLSVEEGYDVRDASHLEELIREAASGNLTYSMERMEREKSEGERRKYVDEVNQKAVAIGLKGVRGRRTLEMVEDEIERKEKEISERESAEEREAIQVAEEFLNDGGMTAADFLRYLSPEIEYTKDEIDEAIARASEIEDGKTEANSSVYSEREAQGSNQGGNGTSPSQEGARATEEGERVTSLSDLPDSSVIRDAEGNEYRVHFQRNHLVVAHPIVDGLAQVSSDTTVRFWVSPDRSPSGSEDRTDPIFVVSTPKFDLSGQTNEQAADQFAKQQEGESNEITKDQADKEAAAVPFSMQMQSQPKPVGVQTGLFTADGHVSSDAKATNQSEPNPLTQTFEQWLDAMFESNPYKDKYVENNDGDVQQAKYETARGNGKTEQAARFAYIRALLEMPRDADLSLDVYDALPADAKREASRHFFGIDTKWSDREQARGKAAYEAEQATVAPLQEELDKVNAELKKRDKGPATQVENKLRQKQAKLENKIADVKSSRSADAGEELTYNKRNRRKDGIKWDEIADKNDALKAKEVVKAKVYPKPDYEALIAGGMKPVIAHMVKQMYDGIASAPKLGRGEVLSDASMKAYIDGVNRVMDGVMAWANDSQAIASWAGRQSRMAGQSFSVMDTFSKNDTPLTFVYPNGWKERQAEVRYLGGNKFYGALQPGYDEVARFLKDQKMGWPAKADLWKKQGYKIIEATGLEVDSRVANRRDGSTSVFAYLSSKGAGRSNAIESLVFDGAKSVEDADVKAAIHQRLSELEGKYVLQDKVGRFVGAFDSMEEAEQGAKDATKREQDSGKVKEIGRVVTEVERIGADRRMEGQNVTAQDLLNTFGFRGINFGNSMQGDSKSLVNERQLHLNHIYDAFLDLAEILNVPPKAMSLNGMLGIAVGAQGSGKALAHFVPGVNEINITRRAGAGALAHEWGHALDHYFANMAGASTKQRPYMTELVSGPKNETVRVDGQWVTRPVSTQNVRQEVADQFRAVVEAMKKRPETEEERKKRLEDGKEKAMSGIKQWMDYFRREVSQVKGVDNSEYIKALDVAEGRINNMDFGDGVIAVSKNTEVHPVVADIKNAVEKATGVAPKTDHLNAISIYIDRAKAFDGVLKSTESHDPQIVDTNYLKTSKSADGKKQQGYWSSTLEMFARALDAYVVDSLKERGNKNEYLSGIEAVAPAGEERKTINKAFDFLFAELKSKETDNGIALYSDSANHAENGEYRTFDDYYKAQASAFNGRPEVERTASVSTDVRADNGIDSIRRRTGSVLANGISADFRDRSATKLTGKVIHTPEDLAVAAQVYRNPKFETARYFFLKDGVVVGQTAVSSRKPGVTKALVGDTMFDQVEHIDDIADQASSLGADSIWLLHNHPDGKPIPSEPDVRATNTLAGAFESRGFKVPYHVIINNKSYGVLNVGEKSITGSVEVFDFGADAQYSIDNPKVSHALLGSMIYSPTDLALNAKKAQVSAGQVVIIGLSGGNGIRTISEVTPAQLRGKFGAAILRRIARQTGSDRLFAYGVAPSDMSAVQAAIKSGLLADAIVVEDGIEMSVIGMSPSLKKRDGYSLGTKDSGVTVEMTAWHGSPHDHDKFDISKIGTGEGAQAYGYGLYFAGGKEVAEWYRNKLSGYSPHNLVLNGEKYNGLSNREMMAFAEAVQKADGLSDKATEILAVLLMKHKGDLPKATDEIGSRTIVPENEPDPDKEWFELEDWAMKGTEQYNQTNGKLYQVELAPSEDEYLDWDKPLSEQSKIIQKSIKDVASEYDDIGFGSDLRQSISDNEKGESFYRLLTRVSGSDKNASRDLERNGARGIRYLDGNSRGAGDGNHNYVIFNDADVSITAKYAKDAKRTDVSPAQIRESLINQFGDAGVRALEKTGMLKIMRLEDAPAEIRKEAEEQGASALYTADGVAYLLSDRMSAEEAPGKLLHEIGEHHGLESMLGSDGWGRMKKRVVAMAKAKGSVANGAWEGVKANYGEFSGMSDEQLAGNDRFLHEVLASIGENKAGLKTSLWRELVAQIKEWLASKGFFTESITEGDIANLVSGSLKKVMRQAQSGLVGQATMTDIAYDYFKDIVSAMKSNKLLIEDCA